MSGEHNGKGELLHDLNTLRQRVRELEQANQALTDFEKQFKGLFENTPVGVYRTAPDGRIIMVNPAIIQMLGYSSFQELLQLNVEKVGFAPGYPRSAFKELIERDGKVVGLESAWIRRDGTILFLIENARAIRDESGKTLYYEGMVQDITKHRMAEDALRESENKYKDLVEELTDVIYTLDTEGNVTSVNKAGTVMFGREPTEVLGKSFTKWIPQEHLDDAMDAFKRIIGGEKITAETVMLDKDGNPHNVEFSSTAIIKDGKVVGTSGTIRDITESKKIEKQLRESEKRFKGIFDNAADGLLLADTETKKFYMANRTICQMLGYTEEEIKSLTVNDIHPLEDLPYIIDQFEKQSRGEIKLAKNTPVRRKDGSVFYADINTFVITLETRLYLTGIFRDVTERRKNELALKRQEETLQAILNATTESVFLIDSNGTILALNSTAAKRLGKDVSDFVGQKHQNIYDPPIPPSLVRFRTEKIRQVFKTGNPVDFEDERAGLIFHTVIYPVFDSDGKVESVAIFAQDITGRKKAEEALRESEQRYRTLAESAQDHIFIIDKQRNIKYVNPYGVMNLGKHPEQVIGKPLGVLFPPEVSETPLQNVERVFETGKPLFGFKDRIKLPDRELWNDTNIIPLKNAKGQVEAVMGISRDITELKMMEQALRESQRWQRAILDSIPDMAWLKDKESKYIAANEALCKAFGIKFEDFVGKTDLDISPKDLAEKYRADDQNVIKTGRRKLVEEQWGKEQGERIWIETIKTPIYNDQGQIIGTSGIARDITERKKLESALIESERRYRTLFDTTPIGVGLSIIDGKVLACNNAMLNMIGYTEAEIRQINLKDTYVNPQERIKLMEKLRANGLVQNFEAQLKRKDGTTYWASITTNMFNQAGQDVLLTVVVDITERKKAEEKIRTLTSAVEQSIDGVSIADLEPKLLYVNKAYARMHGFAPEEMIGMPVENLHNKEKMDAFKADINQLKSQGFGEVEREHIKKDGTPFSIYISTTVLRDNDGQLIGILAVSRDITESKQREKELDSYRQKIARAEQWASVGTLGASLAHELTQPLTVITLSAENALTEMESTSHPAPGMNQLRDMLSEILTVNSIVRRFRDAARKSSERSIRQVVLKEIAERTLKLFDESARRANVTLTLMDFDRLPAILSSEEELGQIFYVLIENAIQAADGKQQRHLVISGEVKDENVVLRFSDNCGGIAPENLDRIFEPFFSTKQAGEATGLGLCIVEHIITRIGGKIHVESKLGEGTTFYITLPIESYT